MPDAPLDENSVAPSAQEADERDGLWLHLLLLAFTLLTTTVIGAKLHYLYIHNLPLAPVAGEEIPLFPMKWMLRHHPGEYLHGLVFSLSLLGILMAHEMGHYLACRRHKVAATLPYFIPAPSFIGSFGAFIRILAPFPSRRALFDVAVAGPIAGFIVSLPVAFLGLALSHPMAAPPESNIELGFPLLMQLMHGALQICGVHAGFTTSQLILHPLAVAGWTGFFATALNLLPCGQLDGGHITLALAPRAHRWISLAVIAALLPLAWCCYLFWLLWAVALIIISRRQPYYYDAEPLDRRRLWLAGFAALMLLLVFTPAPVAHASLSEARGDFADLAQQIIEWLRLRI